jgi:hypothetical protein
MGTSLAVASDALTCHKWLAPPLCHCPLHPHCAAYPRLPRPPTLTLTLTPTLTLAAIQIPVSLAPAAPTRISRLPQAGVAFMGLLYTGKKAYFINANILVQALYVTGLTSTMCLGLECASPACTLRTAPRPSQLYFHLLPPPSRSIPCHFAFACAVLLLVCCSHLTSLFTPSLRALADFTHPS